MKFSKVFGKADPDLIRRAQERLTTCFIELAASPSTTTMPNSSKLGGDPLLFALMQPIEHVATTSIPTAATDGRRYYWSPQYVVDASFVKLRLTCLHEALGHATLMHVQRRGKRHPRLWGLAVDYIANGLCLDFLMWHYKRSCYNDVEVREKAIEAFRGAFSNFITLDQLKAKYADPNGKIPGTENWTPEPFDLQAEKKAFNIERELSAEEEEELKAYALKWQYVYADPDLPNDMKRPERIYDELVQAIPKCGTCGRLGIYHPPGKKEQHDPACPMKDYEGHCDECCTGLDILDFGDLIDEHMDSDVDPTVMAKRLSNALDMARRSGKPGHVPAGLEVSIAELSAPKIHWTDDVSMSLEAISSDGGRNDYTRYRTRPMAMGMLVPRRRAHRCKFACLIDTSASVRPEPLALGVSQLQGLDERGEGTITYGDAAIYWSDTVSLTSLTREALSELQPKGGGGTCLNEFFSGYRKHLGEQDMLIVITDGELNGSDIEAMEEPECQCVWLIVGDREFKAPFGTVHYLEDR